MSRAEGVRSRRQAWVARLPQGSLVFEKYTDGFITTHMVWYLFSPDYIFLVSAYGTRLPRTVNNFGRQPMCRAITSFGGLVLTGRFE